MLEKQFEYGPVASGVFTALLWLTMLVGILWSEWLVAYVGFLIFLGLGLRPLLQVTGLVDRYSDLEATLEEFIHRKHVNKRRQQIAMKERDKKYKYSHYRDPKLPPKW